MTRRKQPGNNKMFCRPLEERFAFALSVGTRRLSVFGDQRSSGIEVASARLLQPPEIFT